MGDQRPRLFHLPAQTSSGGQAAVALAAVAGLDLDPWQQWCVEQILGEKDELYWNGILEKWMRKSSAYESALIIARQNGKGAVLEAIELAWLFLLGAHTIIHSAHEMPTSKEHFERIEGLVSNTPELKAELARGGIRYSNGDERIKLATGQRLVFKTRTKSAVRGFSPDKIVFDEAMILKPEAVAAMKYASSAQDNAQLIYTGSASTTANRTAGESNHFGRARARGMKGIDPRLFFAEWSPQICTDFCPKGCEEHDKPGDPKTWAMANPGMGYRLAFETIQSEYLGDPPEVFNCERLSVGDWPTEDEAWSVISEEGWMNCFDALSRGTTPFTFAIDTSPDKRYSAIVVAGDNGEAGIHTEVTGKDGEVDYRPGTSWVVERAKQIDRKFRNSQWVIDKATQAGAYWDELEKAGLRLITPTTREYAQACGDFFASVMPIGGSTPTIRHLNQPELNSAVAGAEKRDLAEMWAWDKRNSATDICTLVAATNAVWGHRKRLNKPRPKPKAAWG